MEASNKGMNTDVTAEDEVQRQERILLSSRDFERFVSLMTANTEPTETALREAAEFSEGDWVGSRYHW